MLADSCIACLDGVLSHALQIGIHWTAYTLRVGEGLRKIRLGEAEKFGIVKINRKTDFAFVWTSVFIAGFDPSF